MAPPPSPIHIMTKPIGPRCNLDCRYCFYLEKELLYPEEKSWAMDAETLELYIKSYIEFNSPFGNEIHFAWQGGEPTLLGLDYFKQVVALQDKYCPAGKSVTNAFQTNGTLLDDDWCAFFAERHFLIGLSCDGPADLHNYYRVDKGGKDTHEQVMRGASFLVKHKVEFNILCVVNRKNSQQPLKTYRFLRSIGTPHIQFIPLIERKDTTDAEQQLAVPPQVDDDGSPVTSWSVKPEDYGNFLTAIFDEWIRHDVGRVFMQIFEVHLGTRMGAPAGLCVYSETCGKALAMEHNGDLYACDHYVYPEYKLGNINSTSLADMATSEQIEKFGNDKRDTLPQQCMKCDYLRQCWGECPKHRFLQTQDGEEGLNYLCAGLMTFFAHANPYYDRILGLLQQKKPASLIMDILRKEESVVGKRQKIKPNDACPCGSGKKFKKCCGA